MKRVIQTLKTFSTCELPRFAFEIACCLTIFLAGIFIVENFHDKSSSGGFVHAQSSSQTPCIITGSFIAIGTSVQLDNRNLGCYQFRVNYSNVGFSSLSIQLEYAPDNGGVPGSWSAFTGSTVVTDGSNPSTSTVGAIIGVHSNAPWLRLNLTSATGTGKIIYQIWGANSTQNIAGLTGGGGGSGATGPTGPSGATGTTGAPGGTGGAITQSVNLGTYTGGTSARIIGTVYHNTNPTNLFVSVSCQSKSTGGVVLQAMSDSSSTPSQVIVVSTMNATGSSEWDAIQTLVVLPGNYYEVADLLSNCGASGSSGTFWTEWTTGTSGINWYTKTITLTATQVDAMSVTPVLFAAASGSGSILYPTTCTLNAIGSTSFTGGSTIGLYYTSGAPSASNVATGLASATLLTSLSANQVTTVMKAGNIIIPSSTILNAPLYFGNATTPFAGGVGSSLMVSCVYYVQGGLQ